jgi:hypothetical protein
MRPCLSIALSALCLLSVGVIGCAARAAPAVVDGQPSASPTITPERPAFGKTQAEAKEYALADVSDAVAKYLTKTYGDLGWTPTPEFLTKNNAVQYDQPKETQVDGEPGVEVTAHVEMTLPLREKMQKEVNRLQDAGREEVVKQREWLLAKIVGGLVALCLVVAGYIKLEEATRGYYTTLLRVAAGGLVLLAVGLLLIV